MSFNKGMIVTLQVPKLDETPQPAANVLLVPLETSPVPIFRVTGEISVLTQWVNENAASLGCSAEEALQTAKYATISRAFGLKVTTVSEPDDVNDAGTDDENDADPWAGVDYDED